MPLVGRDAELARLLAEARRALQGRGRVLALVGAAGSGKTRVADVLLRRLRQSSGAEGVAAMASFTLYAGDCQRYEQHTPYSAIRPLLRRLLGLQRDDTPGPEHLNALCRERVAQFAPQFARFTPLLGDVLGSPLPETPLIQWLTAAQRQDRLLQLLVGLLLGAAAQKPLVLRLDNLHWADASSLVLLERLAGEVMHAPLLLLLAYRPEPPIAEPWVDQPATMRLVLPALSLQDSALLLKTLLGDTPPAEFAPLLNQTQGNPLFIEELVRMLLDSGALARHPHGGWYLTHTFEQLAIPRNIEEVLLSRLGRLDAQHHELIQVSSVIGQRFDHSIIESAYSRPDLLEQHMAALIAADIVVAEPPQADEDTSTRMPSAMYLFRQPLLRDVVYEGMQQARRRELHRRVAQSIEQRYAHRRDEHLALLAHHYVLAEEWLPAFAYHLAAGKQAQQRYANQDALALFRTAITIFPQVHRRADAERQVGHADAPAPRDMTHQLIDAYERLGDIHLLRGEYDEAQTAYLEAIRLVRVARGRASAEAEADTLAAALVRLHHHVASVQERRADYASAFTWLGHGINQATGKTQGELGRCFLLAAGIYQRQGYYDHALEWTQRALQLIEQEGHRSDLAHAYYSLGGTYGKLGRTQEAIAAIEQSLRLYEALENVAGQADAHNNLANVLAVSAGRLQEAAIHCQAALELKEAIGDALGQAVLANNLGDLKRDMGEYDQAMRYFRLALDQFTALKSDYGVAVLHMNMGAVSLSLGDLDAARRHLEQSRQVFARLGTEEFLAELYRVQAELALAEAQPHAALRWADESLALAQRQQARAEEGEARRVRGLVLGSLGRRAAALDELRQARAIFAGVDNRHGVVRCLEDLVQMTDNVAEAEAALAEAQRIRSEIRRGASRSE